MLSLEAFLVDWFNALVLIMLERLNNGSKSNNKGKGSLCGPGTLICSALSVCFHAFICR